MKKYTSGEKSMHIVYASDNKFAEILGVSMVSLYENNKDIDQIYVYILDNGITDSNKKKIDEICVQNNRLIPMWIPAKDISKELGMQVSVDRGSLSQYARLFVSSILPKELERVLYLDCDVIINASLRELWSLDMEGKVIAALSDAFSKYYRINIDLKPDDIMFNSGVMLIDLVQWRRKGVEKKLMEFIQKKGGKIQQGDQGVLNAVLAQDVFCFSPKFNSVTIFYDFSYKEMLIYRKPLFFYKEDEISEAIETPIIIHYTTSFLSKRPWVEGCEHRYLDRWLEYKLKSPWRDEALWKDNRPQWKRNIVAIYKRIPKIAPYLAGVLQAYVRPIKNRILSIIRQE